MEMHLMVRPPSPTRIFWDRPHAREPVNAHDTRHDTHTRHTTREEGMEGTYLDANIGDEDVLVDDVAAVLLGRVPGQVLLPHPVGHVAVGALEDLLPDGLLGLLEQALVGRLWCVCACVRQFLRSAVAKPAHSTALAHYAYPVSRVRQVAGSSLRDEIVLIGAKTHIV
jgi:hypothetical protein